MTTLTLDVAEKIIAEAKATALANGWALGFAVVDASGRLVASARMDGAQWFTVRVAESKALTSATLFYSTERFVKNFAGRHELIERLEAMAGARMMPAMGGLPIYVDGTCIGGAGASGVLGNQDLECVRAGLVAIGADPDALYRGEPI